MDKHLDRARGTLGIKFTRKYSFQMKSFGPKKFQIPCTDQNVPFWQFFRKGRDGRALILWPSRIPHRNPKILFALGADEFLVMLEGKIRECLFFYVKMF